MEKELISNAWSMSGFFINYTHGLLSLDNNIVKFVTQKGEQFSVPLNEIKNVNWPKMQMGYGVQMEVKGKKYKFTFMQPANVYNASSELIVEYGRIANGIDLINRISNMKDYKLVAGEWRKVLGG